MQAIRSSTVGWTLGLLLVPIVGTAGLAAEPEVDPAPVYMGRAFLFEADVERGRELGWSPPGASSEELLERVAESLEERLRRSGKFVEAVVLEEEGDRLAVVFVGPQSRGFETFLSEGLASAGRIVYRVVASAAERGDCGRSPVGDQTACAGLAPLPWRASVAESSAPVVALSEPGHLLDPRAAEKLELGSGRDGGWALAITLDEEGWRGLSEFLQGVEGRELAMTVDGQVVRRGIDPAELERTLVVEGGFTLDEIRPLTFAFAGEPLPVPLRFLGKVQRQLPNVKHRDSPTAID